MTFGTSIALNVAVHNVRLGNYSSGDMSTFNTHGTIYYITFIFTPKQHNAQS